MIHPIIHPMIHPMIHPVIHPKIHPMKRKRTPLNTTLFDISAFTQIIMEDAVFVECCNQLFQHDQWPCWNQVAALVASMASLHQLRHADDVTTNSIFSC